jgi:hypothetical protein
MAQEIHTDILIVGGGLGGCAAAMAATALGRRVILTEPTLWLGGQLTSQAVPPDEHRWIEQFGCTRRYRQFRDGVRRYYQRNYPLSSWALRDAHLNPGAGGVSRLCHEPRVALAVIEQMLAYARTRGLLTVLLRHEPVAVDVNGDRVRSVTVQSLETGRELTIAADYVLDATELGDLLPLAGVEYVSGAETQAQTGEPHAVAEGDIEKGGRVAGAGNVQAITWCFPMAFDPRPAEEIGDRYIIEKPASYERWRDTIPEMSPPWNGPLLQWDHCMPTDVTKLRQRVLFATEIQREGQSSLWVYRRIVSAQHYDADKAPWEVTLVNWPQNDYLDGNLIDTDEAEHERTLRESRELSLSLLYWMQTEAPRGDGGAGYPGLHLRPDMTGTEDGLAMYPYIRESRRIQALFTVTENHVGLEARGGPADGPGEVRRPTDITAERFDDSVGVGCYRIDLHPSTGGDNYIDISSLPFQIPLGALIPQRVTNLIAACKNIGTTHITNGCYRLHPVEWNIGEAAGALAAYCIEKKLRPADVRGRQGELRDYQRLLVNTGVELSWPATHPV